MGLGAAFKAFWRALTDADFAALLDTTETASSTPEPPPAPAADGLALLALLQRDARLVDFLMEGIDDYDDAQIGGAVRAVHAGARGVLERYFEIGPVLEGEEGARVTVEAGFDPSAITLSGSVSGDPPFTGTLQHHGWRAAKREMPSRPAGQDPSIVAAAEVEVN